MREREAWKFKNSTLVVSLDAWRSLRSSTKPTRPKNYARVRNNDPVKLFNQDAGSMDVAEIEARLARAKAEAILKEYDCDGMVSALSFSLRTN